MKFSEQLNSTAAQNKIEELISNKASITSVDMKAAINACVNQASNVGYSSSSGDDATYKINANPAQYVSREYIQSQDNWNYIGAATSIGTDQSYQFARFAEDPAAKHKEDQMLKQMPIDMTIERMKKCAGCTYTNAVHCMHRFKNGQTDSPCPCNQRDMLVYGHCPKFISTAQVEIELAAKGIDDGKE